jgi:hypothetical protein
MFIFVADWVLTYRSFPTREKSTTITVLPKLLAGRNLRLKSLSALIDGWRTNAAKWKVLLRYVCIGLKLYSCYAS